MYICVRSIEFCVLRVAVTPLPWQRPSSDETNYYLGAFGSPFPSPRFCLAIYGEQRHQIHRHIVGALGQCLAPRSIVNQRRGCKASLTLLPEDRWSPAYFDTCLRLPQRPHARMVWFCSCSKFDFFSPLALSHFKWGLMVNSNFSVMIAKYFISFLKPFSMSKTEKLFKMFKIFCQILSVFSDTFTIDTCSRCVLYLTFWASGWHKEPFWMYSAHNIQLTDTF